MTINHFFLAIVGGLLMIFVFFKPTVIKQKDFGEVPQFQIENFLLHELQPNGLVTLMRGDTATKYSDRYEVKNIDYTDNSKQFQANMQADFGVYKDDVVTLQGNILYAREDGFTFKTKNASYDRNSTVAFTQDIYTAFMGDNTLTGTSLKYNNQEKKVFSKNVKALYQLEESTK